MKHIPQIAVILFALNLLVTSAPSSASDINIRDAWMKDYQQTAYAESSSGNTFSATGTSWQSGIDETYSLSLPFSFPFYGTTYSTCYVDTHGTVYFGPQGTDYLPSVAKLAARKMIAVLWRDYYPGAVSILIESGSDALTIRWQRGSDVDYSATLQSNGSVTLRYGSGNAVGGMIGVSDGTGNYVLSTKNQTGSMSNAQNIVFAPTTLVSKGFALSCVGLGPTNSFDVEACADLTESGWTPIWRHSLGYGYGSGPYTGAYGGGKGFQHSMQFGTTPSGDFEWGSNYTNGTGKMFYRVRQLFPFDLESGFLTLSDGAKMYKSAAGSGPILVFIHGGTQTSDNWLAQVGHFCTSYRVVIYDLRTFGRSDPGIPAYSPWNFSWAQTNRATTDLLELVNSLTNEPVSICGLSMGSAIAAQFATLYPSKVSKLVLASPWSGKTFPRDSQLQTLNALSNRTMVLVGSQDTWGSKEEAQWAQGQGYSAPVTTLQGADHNMNTTDPDLFNAHVDAFLTGE